MSVARVNSTMSEPWGTATTAGERLAEYCALLTHVERRRCLLTLLDRERPVETATAVAGADPLTDRRAALRDVHLPRLAALGLVEWDPQTRLVAQGPTFEEVELLLRSLDDHRERLPDGLV